MSAAEFKHSNLDRRTALLIFGGALLLYLCFFKGEGGWTDLADYLDDTQSLWLKGTLQVREDPPRYNRFAPGLQFIAGPFYLIGHGLSKITNGWVNPRGFAAVIIPLAGALAVALFFCVALAFGVTRRAALWASIIVGLCGPMLTYTQLYYTEVLVSCLAVASIWCFEKSDNSLPRYLFFAGFAMGMMPACHYGAVASAPILWAGMSYEIWQDKQFRPKEKLRSIFYLTIAPACIAAIILCLNYSHFGSPLRTGYQVTYASQADQFFMLKHISGNVMVVLRSLLRAPWIVPAALFFPIVCRRNKRLGLALVLAVTTQFAFWMCYRDLNITTMRYLLPLVTLVSFGLPFCGEILERHVGERGLIYTLIIALLYGTYAFLTDDHTRPFFVESLTGKFVCYTWYMSPPDSFTRLASPVGWPQVLIFGVLSCGGTALLVKAWHQTSADGESARELKADTPVTIHH